MTIAAELTATVRGPAGKIALSLYGPESGEPVVMAHSILTSRRMWQQQAYLLAAEGFRVVCPDTRGHGRSDIPQPPYSMDDLVRDVIAILDTIGIDKTHFVGLSLGAMTGFGLGILFPQRIRSLFLVAGRADAPRDLVAPWDERIRVAQESGCEALVASCLQRWFTPQFLAQKSDVAKRLGELIPLTTPGGLEGCARALQNLDYLSRVRTIQAPTTLVVGAQDLGGLPDAMRHLNKLIKGSVMEEIPESGHFPNIDQPALLNAALLGHFERVAQPTGGL